MCRHTTTLWHATCCIPQGRTRSQLSLVARPWYSCSVEHCVFRMHVFELPSTMCRPTSAPLQVAHYMHMDCRSIMTTIQFNTRARTLHVTCTLCPGASKAMTFYAHNVHVYLHVRAGVDPDRPSRHASWVGELPSISARTSTNGDSRPDLLSMDL